MPENEPRIRTIDQLLNSRWGRMAQDPELRRSIPAKLRGLLDSLPSTHPVVGRIKLALNLFEQSSAGALVNTRNLIILSAALLYTFWPVDAVPDLIPVIGWLDDIGVLTLVLSALASGLHKAKGGDATEQTPEQQNDDENQGNS